jgi:hypothetical protein
VTAIDHRPGVGGNRWRVAGWSVAGLLLLLPAVAMHFTNEVNWDAADFVFAAVLIIGVGTAFELALRMSRNLAYRAAAAVALGTAFLLTWANAAVGIIGSERDPINTVFTALVLLVLIAAATVRFRPRGLAVIMTAAAGVQLAVAAIGLTQDVRGAVMSCVFVGMWAASALLFRTARANRAER